MHDDIQAELIGDLRRLCTIIQHRSTGGHALPFPPALLPDKSTTRFCFALRVKHVDRSGLGYGGAGRIDCQVHNVSCIADLSPELTTLTRQHHQLTWYYKGLHTLRHQLDVSAQISPCCIIGWQACLIPFYASQHMPELHGGLFRQPSGLSRRELSVHVPGYQACKYHNRPTLQPGYPYARESFQYMS